MRRWVLAVVLAAATTSEVVSGGRQSEPTSEVLTTVDPVIDALWNTYDERAAFGHVEFINQFWRLPGNAGFDASLDRVAERMKTSGVPDVAFESTAKPVRAWDHSVGTLAIVRKGSSDDVVLSKEKERLALCINSFSTPPGGVLAPLVDLGRGDRDEDYAGKELKGAIVLGDADVGQLWRRAVVNGGALGVVSTALANYVNPDPPGAKPTRREEWDILQWGSVPYDEARKGFGFKASPRAAARLRQALRRSDRVEIGDQRAPEPVFVRATIASTFVTNPVRTLVVEIPGRTAPAERVVIAAHVQEPGANDNASGVATLAELAVALSSGVRQGKIPPPARTLTFLFLTEIGGSREWLQRHPAEAKQVKYMFSLDMTGEDVTKTGGSFLIERHPDPGAVWDRPWDPHSEWGRGNVRAEQLKGDLINDVHLAIARRVARKTGWVVKTNPYEGGSDHTVFGDAGIPSLLNWHFTDRYYHTNFDTPDKTSPAEMKNVGVTVAASAWFLASANEAQATAAAELVAAAGRARIAVEQTDGEKLAAADRDPAAARAREKTIVTAWRKWYGEAVRSASRLVVGTPSVDFERRLEKLASETTSEVISEPRPREMTSEVLSLSEGPDQAPPALELGKPVFTCGVDETMPEIPLRWDTVVLAGDGRLWAPCPEGNHPPDHREARESAVLAAAQRSRDPELRRLAIQARGRLGHLSNVGSVTESVKVDTACYSPAIVLETMPMAKRWQPGLLPRVLATDSDPRVRREAAYAIATSLSGTPGEYGGGATPEPHIFTGARAELGMCYQREKDSDTAATILETLGRLRYPSDTMRNEVELFLVAESVAADPRDPTRMLGAAKGLEALIRQNAKRPVSFEVRLRLRQLALGAGRSVPTPKIGGEGSAPAPGSEDTLARVRHLAMSALQIARDNDKTTLDSASRDAEWQVRRLVAMQLDFGDEDLARIGERLVTDQAFQVRYDLLAAIGRHAVRTKQCAPVTHFFSDVTTAVVLRALDVLPPDCADAEAALKPVLNWTDELRRPESFDNWHVPARALTALARVSQAQAKSRLQTAVEHPVWQVRASAAAAAVLLTDEATLVTLSGDRVPNVREAAIAGLVRIKSPAVFDAALEALKLDDDQLIRTAAISLRGAPQSRRDDISEALLDTFRRLTLSATDTSRDARVAIIERLEELMPPERAMQVSAIGLDYDPKVRAAAAKAFRTLTNTPEPAGPQAPPLDAKMRYPYQPSEAEMASLPKQATIKIEGVGVMIIELYVDQAPVTVARFAALARAGRYDGLTFHRVVPNFVIQGGSPGANEYAGTTPRYLRDEPGFRPHVRGAVGISTRGRDTGDAQIFIDLVDLPRLDHDYTVFGRVLYGLDIMDRVLEGAKIESIVVK